MTKTVFVSDAGRSSAIAIIRSLGRQGLRVIAADSQSNAIGFHSRYTSSRFVYPAPEENPEAFVDAVHQYIQDEKVDLIIPVTDEVILPLSQARERFAGLCHIAMAELEALDIVTNKLKTFDLAKEQNVPLPTTHLLNTEAEAKEIADSLQWPVVLKPMRSRLLGGEGVEAFHVVYAGNAEELLEHMRHFEGRCEVLLQEYTPGEGHGIELLLYEGKPVCAFQHKRLHEVPITGGASALRESVAIDPKLLDYSLRMMSALKWTGLAMVEFKLTADGPKLMEINGRVWGSLPLATHSGMDFPKFLADIYLNDSPSAPPKPHTDYTIGIKARNLSMDIVWWFSLLRGDKRRPYLETPSRSELLPAALSYLNPFYKTDVQSWDDPLPGILELPQIVTKIIGKVTGADK